MPLQQIKRLWLPFLIVLVPGTIFSLSLPYFPVDETRYLSVAWEMKHYNSFIVPLQNGLPYSHKPPFLFWLVNLNWLLFGVNEATLRFIPMLFSLCNIALVYRLALKLWDDEKSAWYAALMLASTLSYLLWSTLIMFDLILTTWVLLALSAVVAAAKEHSAKQWLVAGVAIGGGLLTKGPAVLVYILPAALLAFLWMPAGRCSRRWYGWLALSVLVGVAVILLWLVPAALTGGETYRNAILWGQTVNRMANSFAHKRPIWWYLPWLPALLLPWALLPPAWRGVLRWKEDAGCRFAMVWGVATLVIFSLISGKQVHYMIPAIPAFALLMGRGMATGAGEEAGKWRFAIPAFYCVLGAVAFAVPFTKLSKGVAKIGISGLPVLACGLLLVGLALFFQRRRSTARTVAVTAVSSIALAAVIFTGDVAFFKRYDLHGISDQIRQKQSEGYSVLHYGKYHGQFHFMGRLQQPLVPVYSMEEVSRYAATHDKVALITYERQPVPVPNADVMYEQPFRSRRLVMWNKSGMLKMAKASVEDDE